MNKDVIEIESIPTKIEYKGIVWVPASTVKANHSKGNVKKSYIVKWVGTKSVGDIFTKDDFYKEYPKHKSDGACKRRVDESMQDMILDKCITVHDNIPGKYRVLK